MKPDLGRRFFSSTTSGGNVLNYRRFAQLVGKDQPIFGIRSPALESDSKSASLPESVEALAALYIEAVTEVAGQRPIALGGLSFGGKVAFEMARQLDLAGREVAFVSLFDTRFEMAEFLKSSGGAWKANFRRAWYQMRRAGFHARNVFATPSSEGENYLKGRLRKRRKKARARQGSTDSTTLRDPRDQLSPEQLAAAWHRKIGTAYHPLPTPVPIQYFCAQDVPLAGPFNNMANWNYLATGVLNVIPVPGNHTSILEEPNVTVLAQEFWRNAYAPAPSIAFRVHTRAKPRECQRNLSIALCAALFHPPHANKTLTATGRVCRPELSSDG